MITYININCNTFFGDKYIPIVIEEKEIVHAISVLLLANIQVYVRMKSKREDDIMGMAELERRKDEKIDGVIYDMSPSPSYRHGIVNGNLYLIIKQGLKDSICLVSMENLDFKYHPDKHLKRL